MQYKVKVWGKYKEFSDQDKPELNKDIYTLLLECCLAAGVNVNYGYESCQTSQANLALNLAAIRDKLEKEKCYESDTTSK